MEQILPYHVEASMSVDEKIDYYQQLRSYCETLSRNKQKRMSYGQQAISKFYNPKFYDNNVEILGMDNIPSSIPVLFICNHSNSHDIFSMYSILEKLGISSSVMVATDCLNPFSIAVFAAADSTFLDRNDKISANESIYELSSKIMAGKSGVIFGESTWNLHPIKPMQNLKIGGAKIAAITGAVVVPTVLEYIEKPYLCGNEMKMYDKIVLSFGKPIQIGIEDDLSYDTELIQKSMEEMRREIWKKNSIYRDCLDNIIPELYINHLYLKKFLAFGFKYDSLKESAFLRADASGVIENEYCLNEKNEFVPGITYQYRKKSKR